MDAALTFQKENPDIPQSVVAEMHNIPPSTYNDHHNGTHSARGVNSKKRLSNPQEEALIEKINTYSDRGTLLKPKHIREFANSIINDKVGVNWTSNFLRRYSDRLSSRYYKLQEASRLKADNPEDRQAFYELMKEVINSGQYTSENIYNMDETGFPLSATRRARRAAPKGSKSKSQSTLAKGTHITAVATISTTDSPVPPYLIYSGKTIVKSWMKIHDEEPNVMVDVSESGYINSVIARKWLISCFDHYSKERAGNKTRLLIMDGHDTHTQVSFLEECWKRNIVCLILPANMTSVYQPLDVNYFNILKHYYEEQVDAYQLGSYATRVNKDYFFRWFQRAWKETATSKQIRSAWAKTGIYPLNQEKMGAIPATPPPQIISTEPNTPNTPLTLQSIDRQVRKGEIDIKKAFHKTSKALIQVQAEKVLAEKDSAWQNAATELDKEVSSGGKRLRYAQGQVFDLKYQENHAGELEERKEGEQGRKKKKRQAKMLRSLAEVCEIGDASIEGSSTGVQNLEIRAVMHVEK